MSVVFPLLPVKNLSMFSFPAATADPSSKFPLLEARKLSWHGTTVRCNLEALKTIPLLLPINGLGEFKFFQTSNGFVCLGNETKGF